nr:PHP domain-containing protein [Streptomyces humicola]
MPGFTHLHATSGYSARYGASLTDQLAVAAAERDLDALALTDRDTVGGVVRSAKACTAAGIRPLFGASLAVPETTPPAAAERRRRTPVRGGASARIVAGRPYTSLRDLRHRAHPSRPVVENLIKVGACDTFLASGLTRRDLLLQTAELHRARRAAAADGQLPLGGTTQQPTAPSGLPETISVVGSAAWNLADLARLRTKHGRKAVADQIARGPGEPRPVESSDDGRRIRMPTGYEMNPRADLEPAGDRTATGRKLWHSSPGSAG